MEIKTVRLGDIAEIKTGPFGSALHNSDYVSNGIPIITVEHIGDLGIVHSPDVPRVNADDYERLSAYRLKTGDIVFSRVGAVDRTAIVRDIEDGWLFSGRLLRVRPNANAVDADFLNVYFSQPRFRKHMYAIANGSTMPSINTKILASVEIELPSMQSQKVIAWLFRQIDEKQIVNQQINNNLLKITDDMFNRVYLGNELVKNSGKVKLSSIIRTKSGTFNPKKTSEVFVNHFSMPAFDAARFPVVNAASGIKSNKNIVEPFSILVSKMNPDVKRVWLPNTSKKLLNVASTEFLTFNADAPEMQAFVYAVVNDKRYQKYLESNTTGSTNSRQRVLPKVAYSYEIPYVKEAAQQFGFQIVDIIDMIKLNKEQNQHLIRLRNILLPKLLAGDIDLSNIETVMNNNA
ncbi:restriction endonuclease subunit S [Lacticaseibacillus paracasei]|uniref:restriction endonuclease subunit S n=1 Tax=Lacticaseibacillus paracasei TaxID=1597 RepID=UPI001F50501D|nr:restriction endonuclease subunit S [Lacticaseibacillus paracasei]MCI0374566.1 restriction endonuclease subunit S [Lacticaseibacillus paracasei]